MKTSKWLIAVAGFLWLCMPNTKAAAQILSTSGTAEDSDLYSLVLISSDLSDAHETMTICDLNEDGYIDAEERSKLPWRSEFADFDLNQDGKLTHLEVAVRQAKKRAAFDITQFDRNNSQAFIRRYDANGNGQLDADEIADRWPPDPSEFDKDEDGIITLAEIAKQFAFKRGLRRELGIEAVDNMSSVNSIKKFDVDGDRLLDSQEWAAAGLPLEGKSHDSDGDGKLSQMELSILFAKHRRDLGLSKSDGVKAKRILAMADANQDGKISDNEMNADIFAANPQAASQYSQFDADSDGTVTLGEIQQAIAAERKKLGYSDSHVSNARRLLLRHDADRSTFIEAAELAQRAGPGKLTQDTLNSADQNQDGRLSLEELAKHLAEQE